MNVAISGITGLIGRALHDRMIGNGHRVTRLSRDDFKLSRAHLAQKLEGIDAVVHLSGAPILKKWTPQYKRIIYSSRVDSTSRLVSAINDMEKPPGVFVSASAVGIYDTFEVHDEYSTVYADDFLGNLCVDWEGEALKVDTSRVRLSIIRLGMVLSTSAGALKKMLLPFKLGLGGKIGDGLQPMPFIHIDDLTRAVDWIINNKNAKGIFNMVAPHMISNLEFTKALAAILHRPALFTIPEFALKLLYGETSGVLIKGQKVISKRLAEEGIQFNNTDIHSTLSNLLTP
jgi:uncharacterized protein (TIGR01777 family)